MHVKWIEPSLGFGKPPPSTRFQKGRSGNPKGSAKGRHNRPPYDRGNRMTPSTAKKGSVSYRYYVSSVLAQGRKGEAGAIRPRVSIRNGGGRHGCAAGRIPGGCRSRGSRNHPG